MLQRNAQPPLARHPRRPHEIARPQRQRAAARKAREDGYVEDADGDDGVDRPRPGDGGYEDGEKKRREGEDEIVGAHDDLVHEAALGRREEAERHARAEADAGRHQRDRDGVARAAEDHRKDVAAHLVGAEPVRGRRRHQPLLDEDEFGVIGRPDERQPRRREDQRGQREADGEAGGGPLHRRPFPTRGSASA